MNEHNLPADHHYLHWTTQLDHFITVRAGGTPYGMYKQAQRELDKRVRGLTQLHASRQRLQIDIEELEYCIKNKVVFRNGRETSASRFDVRRMAVDLEERQKSAPHNERLFLDHERERERFQQQSEHLAKHLDITPENPLTPERRTILDREMWLFLLRREAASEIITSGRIAKNTLAMIMSLPTRERNPILALIRGQIAHYRDGGEGEGPLLDWFFQQQPLRLLGEVECESLPSPRPLPSLSNTESASASPNIESDLPRANRATKGAA